MKLVICAQVVDSEHPILGFFHGWIAAFAERFDTVTVICLEVGVYDLPPNVTVHSLGKERGMSKLGYVFNFYRLFNAAMCERPNYVFFHMGAIFNVLAAPYYLVRGSTKFLWWKAHGTINWFGRFALLFVDEVVTSTASGFPIATPKRRIIGQAINTDHFSCTGMVARNPLRVIYVGRIAPIKRIEIWLKTIKQVRDSGYDIDPVIIGPYDSEEYTDTLFALCDEYELSSSIFAGSMTQAELQSAYCRAGIFLNTSLTHSMDKTVLEAMLCGCVPVTSNRAFADLLSADGLYLAQESVDAYAAALKRLMDSDTASLQAILRERVVAQHSLGTFTSRVFV